MILLILLWVGGIMLLGAGVFIIRILIHFHNS